MADALYNILSWQRERFGGNLPALAFRPLRLRVPSAPRPLALGEVLLSRVRPPDPKETALAACMRAFESEFEFVYRALRRFGLTPADAEDMAQDVFVVMLRRWRDFDPQRPLRPWLLGITHRVAMHHLRRSWRETPHGFVDREDERPHVEDEVTAKGARRLVTRALAELKEKQREVFVLHELEGVPMQEIAKSSGEPLQTLYSRLKSAHRAFGRVVRRLGRFPSGATAVFPVSRLLESERTRLSPSPEVRRRVLDRALARSEVPGGPLLKSLARPGLVYATMGAVVVATALALVSGAQLLAADRPRAPDPSKRAPIVAMTTSRNGPAGAEPRAARFRSGRAFTSRPVLAPRPLLPRSPLAERLGTHLIGYWRFDDGLGTRAVSDFSGHGTDCVLHGIDGDGEAAQVEGPVAADATLGSAVRFGGRTWLECPKFRVRPDRRDELSIALWVRPGRAGGYRTLVSRQWGDATADHFYLGLVNRQVLLKSPSLGGRVEGPTLPAGVWTHLAATFRHGTTTLYVNGGEVGHAVGQRVPRAELARPLTIGAGMNGPPGSRPNELFRGAIDELLVYDRALAPEEVAALSGGMEPLVAH